MRITKITDIPDHHGPTPSPSSPPSNSPSSAQPMLHHLQMRPAPNLFDARGIIDTVRVVLRRAAISESDRLGLEGSASHVHGGRWYDNGARSYRTSRRYRLSCGVRVIESFTKHYVAVEFSVPRLQRGCNSLVHEVSVEELLATITEVTAELMPDTTARGLERGERWAVERLDLAIDVHVPVQAVLQAYRVGRWRCVRSWARSYPSGIEFRGHNRRIVLRLYDKVAEMLRRREKSAHERGHTLGAMGEVLRVELELRRTTLRLLADVMEPCAPGEGLLLRLGPKEPAVWRRVDYNRMRALMARELRSIEANADRRVRERPPRGRFGLRVGMVEEHPPFMGLLRASVASRSLVKLWGAAFGVALRRLGGLRLSVRVEGGLAAWRRPRRGQCTGHAAHAG